MLVCGFFDVVVDDVGERCWFFVVGIVFEDEDFVGFLIVYDIWVWVGIFGFELVIVLVVVFFVLDENFFFYDWGDWVVKVVENEGWSIGFVDFDCEFEWICLFDFVFYVVFCEVELV